MSWVDSVVQLIISYVQNFGIGFGMVLIVLESMIPVLPLGVFIAFNIEAFGGIVGFIISWIATCVGCLISYFLCSKVFGDYIIKKSKKKEKINLAVSKLQNMKFTNLVLLIALPFTPAFIINIACGISKVDLKKFIPAMLIGKLSIVYFWGIIGKGFIESVTDIDTLITLAVLLGICYLLSRILNKRIGLD